MIEHHKEYLEICQKKIESLAGQTIELANQLKAGQEELSKLVKEYQQKRYSRQVEIWAKRGLTRCTNCFDSPQRNWGLIPLDDVLYISTKGDHWHTNHESDSHHTHLWLNRLCNVCYMQELKDCATSKGGLRVLNTETVNYIDEILATQKGYEADKTIRERIGRADDIRVYWHQLPIPEQAYEIGKII